VTASRVLRLSTLFHRTLRDDPADAEVASHRLLVRAGYVRRVAPGIYTWLPLGWRTLRRVEEIVREEMDRVGAQELHFPALLPREPYEATGRWTDYGESLFRLQDRRGADHLLGPTHEEMFALVVKDLCTSYKDLPVLLYQIQVKYRDEVRPRAGLLRGREFLMKDSYSFDLDDEALARSYQVHRDAYLRIFRRLGLPIVAVEATAGAMGGSASEEFLAPMDAGEDTFARCSCGYAANVEAVTVPAPDPRPIDGLPAARVEDTPGTPTIGSLVAHLDSRPDLAHPDRPWTAADTLKNVVVMVQEPDGSEHPLAVGLPGDRELDLTRLAARLAPATVRVFEDTDFGARPHLVRGYIGPGALGRANDIPYLVDPRVAAGTAWVTGANEDGRHVVGLVAGRDFEPDGTIDAAEVRAGDPCPVCGAALALDRGVEIGHIFQLGRRYTAALGVQVLGPDGTRVTPTMGSYGIGISRAVAAIAEVTSDDRGLCWPAEVAPADVHLVAAGRSDEIVEASDALSGDLAGAGLRVLYDDRPDASVGVKLTDAELIGIPTIVVVGKRLADGAVEVRDRQTGEVGLVPLIDAVARLSARAHPG
jgi:prolyl-tRNA synthetase